MMDLTLFYDKSIHNTYYKVEYIIYYGGGVRGASWSRQRYLISKHHSRKQSSSNIVHPLKNCARRYSLSDFDTGNLRACEDVKR